MRRTPIARLGDATLDASAQIQWSEVVGVEPFVTTYTLDAKEAEKIPFGEPLTLYMEDSRGKSIEVHGLYCMGWAPTVDQYRRTLVIADQRIWWRRTHVFRRANIRTRAGDKRRLNPDGTEFDEKAPVVADISYKRYSIIDGTKPYTASELLGEILDEVVGPGGWTGSLSGFDEALVNHVEIDGSGPAAISQVLGFIPGAQIVVRASGKVEVINKFDHVASKRMVESMGPYPVGNAHAVQTDLSKMRPSHINVGYQVEQELRIDKVNSGETVDLEGAWCENVIPVPDYTLEMTDNTTAVEGMHKTPEELFAAWNNAKGTNPYGAAVSIPDIDDAAVRTWWLRSYLEHRYAATGVLFATDTRWDRRIAAVRRYYRTRYRINRRLMQKLHGFKVERVAIWDEETGQPAPSRVYTDYAIRWSERGILASRFSQGLWRNVPCKVSVGAKLDTGASAPADLVIVDEDIGIVDVVFRPDHLQHVREIVAQGHIEQAPTLDAEDWRQRNYFTDGTALKGADFTQTLKAEHRLAFIITVFPGAPNSRNNLYWKEVRPAEAQEFLPSDLGSIGDCQGPPWDIRVGVTTARFAWDHDKSSAIMESLGVNGGDGTDRGDIEDLLQNVEEMEELSKSVAAGLYGSMVDRVIGSKTVQFRPETRVVGSMTSVSHTLSPSGMMVTTASVPDEVRQVDPMALVPNSVRRLVQRMVQFVSR